MPTDAADTDGFDDLDLAPAVHAVLHDLGYHTPSPIQQKIIPYLLDGRDVIGQAQTGTGKTAAFALPILSRLTEDTHTPQVLVLAPTRELANQVAEAFNRYSARMSPVRILPIYGGQDYRRQIRGLRDGVHIVVGTPGRVMDHMRKGTLRLDNLKTLVLDEADEMLRMGFIEDVEWILEHTPDSRQIALFSATMPDTIRRVAERYLNDPEHVAIETNLQTAETVTQLHCIVRRENKLEALTRFLEYEQGDGIIVFTRTRSDTVEVAEALVARGFAAAPMNGDIPQSHRERTVRALKDGRINILVATDVAARGLDIDRISHVINYDMPHDTEAYVHRIGRTGRAGRDGDAILFVMPNQKRKLKAIERETGTRIKYTDIPGIAKINEARGRRFKQRLSDAAATAKLDEYRQLIEELQEESDLSAIDIAAAAAQMANGERPLFMDPSQERENHRRRSDRPEHKRAERGHSFEERKKKEAVKRRREPVADERVRTAPVERRSTPESGMEKFRIEVGRQHGVNPGNIVGAIANEAGLDTEYIGHINIYDDYSTVDLPEGMPKTTLKHLRRVWVAGRKMNISRAYHKKNREKAASHEEAEATVEPAKKQSRKPRKKDRHRDRQPAPGGFRARKKK